MCSYHNTTGPATLPHSGSYRKGNAPVLISNLASVIDPNIGFVAEMALNRVAAESAARLPLAALEDDGGPSSNGLLLLHAPYCNRWCTSDPWLYAIDRRRRQSDHQPSFTGTCLLPASYLPPTPCPQLTTTAATIHSEDHHHHHQHQHHKQTTMHGWMVRLNQLRLLR